MVLSAHAGKASWLTVPDQQITGSPKSSSTPILRDSITAHRAEPQAEACRCPTVTSFTLAHQQEHSRSRWALVQVTTIFMATILTSMATTSRYCSPTLREDLAVIISC